MKNRVEVGKRRRMEKTKKATLISREEKIASQLGSWQ